MHNCSPNSINMVETLLNLSKPKKHFHTFNILRSKLIKAVTVIICPQTYVIKTQTVGYVRNKRNFTCLEQRAKSLVRILVLVNKHFSSLLICTSSQSLLSIMSPRYLNWETYDRLQTDIFRGGKKPETTLCLLSGLNTKCTLFSSGVQRHNNVRCSSLQDRQEGHHPLTGQRAANFRPLTNQ